MKKSIKFITVSIMILGIILSVLNFVSTEATASIASTSDDGENGVWAYTGGRYVCMYSGSECKIGGGGSAYPK